MNRTIGANNSCCMPVTDNLFNALSRLRRRFKMRILWVDRLCINQTDMDERGQQVSMMGRIYREAKCVNIWLGEPDAATPSWSPHLNFQVPCFTTFLAPARAMALAEGSSAQFRWEDRIGHREHPASMAYPGLDFARIYIK